MTRLCWWANEYDRPRGVTKPDGCSSGRGGSVNVGEIPRLNDIAKRIVVDCGGSKA